MEYIMIKDITYRYPTSENNVLQNISINIKKGELCVIVGANGSGKTTLCNAIRGFIPSFYKGEISGEILIDGKNIFNEHSGDLALKMGFAFQNPFTQISGIAKTVYDELVFGLENMGVDPSEIDNKVTSILKLIKIDQFADRDPFKLSGGQQQRVALAAILVMGQEILIIDEPTSQMDPQSTDEIFEIISLMKNMGKTVILVEHKMNQVANFADHIVVMENGHVVMDGTPREIFTNEKCIEYHSSIPQATKIIKQLIAEGILFEKLPITTAEAIEEIKKIIS